MSRIIAILGVDGSGKSTFLNQLETELAGTRSNVRTLKVPQFHLTPGTERPQLSRALESLGQHADRSRDPVLKAMSLFLAMPLYGEAATVLSGQAKWIISERHPLIDSLAYAAFYRKLMSATYDWPKLANLESIALVMDWAATIMARWLPVKKQRLEDLPSHMAELFALNPAELMPLLKKIYRCEYPDEAIVLTIDRELLEQRLATRHGPGEIHVNAPTIMMLQEALIATARLAEKLSGKMKLTILGCEEIKKEQVLQKMEPLTF